MGKMKKYSVWKEVEIYKEALQKICSVGDTKDGCSRIAHDALSRVSGDRKRRMGNEMGN